LLCPPGTRKGRAAALFGSAGRGDETQGSDVDFLVEFEPGSSLFDLADLEDELASLLGSQVDVVSAGGLKPRDHYGVRPRLVSRRR
jgi:predicted nucleotidyltransferase